MRYTNPHMPHQHQQPIQQRPQPFQTPGGPFIQFIQQPGMMNPQMQPSYMQQYPIPPNMMQPGMVDPRYVQQFQQQQQQFHQQFPQQPPQFNPQVNVGGTRFTGGQTTPQQQFNTVATEGGRYQTSSTQQLEEENAESNIPLLFSVKPTIHKFLNNEKVKLNTITSELKDSHIQFLQNSVASDCVQEVIESLIEQTYTSDAPNKPLTVRKFIVTHNLYQANVNIGELLSGDVKSLYKQIKVLYREADNKYTLTVLDTLDNLLTDRINDYIIIHAKNSISIDSFITDFNDLLKVLRNNEEDLEDTLIDYLDKFIKEIKLDMNHTPKTEKDFYTIIPESYTIAYLDKHVTEAGLDSVNNRFVQLEETASNIFLQSLAIGVTKVTGTKEFLLVTTDRSVFKVMINENNNVFYRLFS